jgi:hypothetical protein
MRLGAEQSFSVKHIGKDKIVPVNRLSGDFLFSVDALNRFTYDCQFGHLYLLKNNRSSRSNSSKRSSRLSDLAVVQTARWNRRFERFERLELIKRFYSA